MDALTEAWRRKAQYLLMTLIDGQLAEVAGTGVSARTGARHGYHHGSQVHSYYIVEPTPFSGPALLDDIVDSFLE